MRAVLAAALLLGLSAPLRADPPAEKGDHNEDGHPDNGLGRENRDGAGTRWSTRADYTRPHDPDPRTVVVTVPEGETPYRPYAWGHMTATVARNYKAKVRDCGNAACSVWQTGAAAVALPVGVVLDVPFWVGRALAWPFRSRAKD